MAKDLKASIYVYNAQDSTLYQKAIHLKLFWPISRFFISKSAK